MIFGRFGPTSLKKNGFDMTTSSTNPHGGSFFNRDVGATGDALSVVLGKNQDALLLSDIEARLTNDVKGIILSLTEFAGSSQSICKEIPANAHFCKLIASTLQLFSLQIAVALGQGLNKPIFSDDGRQYLADLGLSLNDLIREIDLDGRKFMAIALVDKKSSDFLDSSNGAQ